MKPRFVHIIALTLLLAAGCDRHDNPLMKRTSPVEQNSGQPTAKKSRENQAKPAHPDTYSRFAEPEELPDVQTTSAQEPTVHTGYEYYVPAEQIEKPIPVRDFNLEDAVGYRKPDRTIDREPGHSGAPDFFRFGRVSGEFLAGITVDNDLFDNTDRYYTSGVAAELYHPLIASSPFSVILPGLKHSLNYHGVIFRQNMYTPLKLDKYSVRIGDRPFACYITLSQYKISLSEEKHRRMESGFSLGVIGPAALGGVMQDVFHTEEPLGWVNQVQNDLVANYDFRFEQGVYCVPGFEMGAYAGMQAGTLYDNAKIGVFLQAGRSNGRYASAFLTSVGPQRPFARRIRYYFTLDLENKVVFYDATLQGGMINRESVYTLAPEQVSRYVFTGRAGFGIGFGRISLEAEQVYLTPEFDGGFHHFWFRIRSIVHLN